MKTIQESDLTSGNSFKDIKEINVGEDAGHFGGGLSIEFNNGDSEEFIIK